jgi:hypothetical protein
LRELIQEEDQIKLERSTILLRHDNVTLAASRLAPEDAIPCCLHMEMRVSEKIIYTLLSDKMDSFLDGDGKKRKSFVAQVTTCMFDEILGDVSKNPRHKQWKFPLREGGKQVHPSSMTNTHARKIALGLKRLVQLCFDPVNDESSSNPQQTRLKNERKGQQWIHFLDVILPMMKEIRRHNDFTKEEIDRLHVQTSKFMALWVELYNGRCITNYIHMIGAGHLHYYLSKYRNLYKFSQQGWEAMNQKLKHFYFNNTNHGGCGGNSTGVMVTGDHVLPLKECVYVTQCGNLDMVIANSTTKCCREMATMKTTKTFMVQE